VSSGRKLSSYKRKLIAIRSCIQRIGRARGRSHRCRSHVPTAKPTEAVDRKPNHICYCFGTGQDVDPALSDTHFPRFQAVPYNRLLRHRLLHLLGHADHTDRFPNMPTH